MAAGRIKGITIEIEGKTDKLVNSLKGVDKQLNTTKSALKDVNKLLKLDPSNTELLTQKQKALKKAVNDTSERLKQLRKASENVTPEDIGQDRYDALQREIAATEADLKDLKKQAEDFGSVGTQQAKIVGEKLQVIGGICQDVGKKLTTYVTLPLAALGGYSFKSYASFEDSIAKVGTIADETQVPLDELESQIMELSNRSGVAAADIAEAVYGAMSAGQATDKAVGFVETANMLAKAGFTDSATATDVLTTALNAYGLSSEEAIDVSNKLIATQNLGKTTVAQLGSSIGKVIPTAAMFNTDLDNVSSAYVTLTKNGIGTAESTTYLNGMLNELGKSGTKVSEIVRKRTGKSFSELMESGWDLSDVMGVLQEESKETGSSVADMFGSQEASKAAAVIMQHSEDFKGAMSSMEGAAGTTQTAFDELEETTSSKLGKSINQLKNDAIVLGGALATTLGPIIEKVTEYVKKFSDWFQKLDPETQDLIIKIGLIVAAVGPILGLIGSILTGIGSLIIFAPILGAAIAAIGAPVAVIVGVIGGLIAVGALLIGNWDNIVSACADLKDNVISYWQGVGEKVGKAVGDLKTTVSTNWNSIKNGVTTAASTIYNTVTSKFQSAKTSAVSAFEGLRSGITGKLESAKSSISGTLDKIRGFFSGLSLKIPEIQLPHLPRIRLTTGSKTILGKTFTYPSGFEFYAKAMKDAYLLDGPTVFGMNGGRAMVGGEAGKEVILGLDKLKQFAGSTVVNVNMTVNGAKGQDVNVLADRVAARIYQQVRRAGA